MTQPDPMPKKEHCLKWQYYAHMSVFSVQYTSESQKLKDA